MIRVRSVQYPDNLLSLNRRGFMSAPSRDERYLFPQENLGLTKSRRSRHSSSKIRGSAATEVDYSPKVSVGWPAVRRSPFSAMADGYMPTIGKAADERYEAAAPRRLLSTRLPPGAPAPIWRAPLSRRSLWAAFDCKSGACRCRRPSRRHLRGLVRAPNCYIAVHPIVEAESDHAPPIIDAHVVHSMHDAIRHGFGVRPENVIVENERTVRL